MNKLDLSGFKKITFSSDIYSKLASKLLDSPYIKDIIEKYQITESEFYNESNIIDLSRMLELSNCEECKSIDGCNKSGKIRIVIKRNIDNQLEFLEYPCQGIKRMENINFNIKYNNYKESNSNSKLTQLKALEYFKKLKHLETRDNLFFSASSLDGINAIAHKIITELAYEKSVAYLSFNDFLSDLKTKIRNKESYSPLIESLYEVDYLFITGIGLERTSEFSRDEILLNLLLNRKKDSTTIICSIYSLEKLSQHFIADKEAYKNIKIERIINIITNLANNIIEI